MARKKEVMKEIHSKILDFIYPRRCPVCQEIIMPKGELVCADCYLELKLVKDPRCMKCGKPIDQEEKEYCFDCQKRQFHYEYGYGMWVYDEKMQHSIAAFKYKNKREYGDFYVSELLRHYQEKIRRMEVDVIVPVPVHAKKLRKRGYNQAALLAKGVGDALGIAVETNLLVRTKNTLPQKTLDDRERFRNLSEAFGINPNVKFDYMDKKVLLIDDIYTTGSTIEVCTNVLLAAGVGKVYYISVCIGRGY